ncbi:hypothetical protein [Thalassobacillus pellis]|uniref:hypothetical protein n=1 Tax=Thalassobacillus pellis TaxID=748008 RepID=UPI00196119AB|nr:hypothetical protein [Thalassobacillus pellis]MBM7551425.1 hypothetical protein [Thalassobacillus pellis]
MPELEDTHHQILMEYNKVLDVLSEGFGYLAENISQEAPPEAQRIFLDILHAFERLSKSHEYLTDLFGGGNLLDDFREIILLLSEWFHRPTNSEKRELLVKSVIPCYENWKNRVQQIVRPYIIH